MMINEGLLSFGGIVEPTFSSAMDCRNSYNVERMLYLVSDGQTVSKLMAGVEVSKDLKPIKLEKDLRNTVRVNFTIKEKTIN